MVRIHHPPPGPACLPARAPAGVAQLVERQPSKLNVAGSNPVARSVRKKHEAEVQYRGRSRWGIPPPPSPSAHLAQSVEHVLGKDGVVGSNPMVGSAGLQEPRDRSQFDIVQEKARWPRRNLLAPSPT